MESKFSEDEKEAILKKLLYLTETIYCPDAEKLHYEEKGSTSKVVCETLTAYQVISGASDEE